ncbi:MAG: hypothetical protein JSS27_06650 [Planctomycetes bacterium]|nr:hypothetical protein [Planctomycetota bacterium]
MCGDVVLLSRNDMDTRAVEVYRAIHRDECLIVALSLDEAWQNIRESSWYDDDPSEWCVAHSTETIPVVQGEVVVGGGEAIDIQLDEIDAKKVSRQPYIARKLFWYCPHCGDEHIADIFRDPLNQCEAAASPLLWNCERLGLEGLVFIAHDFKP